MCLSIAAPPKPDLTRSLTSQPTEIVWLGLVTLSGPKVDPPKTYPAASILGTSKFAFL